VNIDFWRFMTNTEQKVNYFLSSFEFFEVSFEVYGYFSQQSEVCFKIQLLKI
jgi:hypothetical protein